MTAQPIHYRMQKRIGLVFLIACLSFALLNVGMIIVNARIGPMDAGEVNTRVFNAAIDAAIGLVAFLLSLIDHVVIRIVQVAAFAAIGVLFNVTNQPWDAAGVAVIVFAMILAIQYSFFERRFTLKVVLSLSLVYVVILLRTVLAGRADFIGSLAMVGGVTTYLLLLWIAFSDVLKDLAAKAKDLELELRKDSVFVRFGRNVAGLVHNLSNMLSVLYGMNELMRQHAQSAEMADFITKQQNAFDRMTGTLERILAVVRAKQDTSVCAVDLNTLLGGVVEYYRTDFEFKNAVRVDMKPCAGKLVVEAQPLELCEIVENLIKNSWEAMKGGNGGRPPVIEVASFDRPVPGFSIRDSGCGMPGLERCRNDECRAHFQVGRTTKEKGTGLGIPFVLEAVKANGWTIVMESAVGRGTVTSITFGDGQG